MPESEDYKELLATESVKEWLKNEKPEEKIRVYLEKQKQILSSFGNGETKYAPSADPNTREICEMTICEVCRTLVPPPKGFAPITDQYAIIRNRDGQERSAPHMFYFNQKENLVLCLSPGQFVDDILGSLHGTRFDRKGFRITTIKALAQDSSIQFIESPNEAGNFVMLGKPEEIKSVLGVDYFGKTIPKD